MPLKILEVQPRSPAAKAGITAMDTILSINAMPVNDFFDLEFYANDYHLDFELASEDEQTRLVTVLRQTNKSLGIEPVAYDHNNCRNNCVFCFIDQMPPGLRNTLYKKDDDYLYSYVFGNYISLTNLRESDFRRIIKQHISPLYISLHCTDTSLRRKMMRYPHDMDTLGILKRLAENGISYHLQIVCVPGYNCGDVLRETLHQLVDPSLATLSIGIVPVGLTKFRDKLTSIKPFDSSLVLETLDIISSFQDRSDIIYAADELFITAGLPLPEAAYYGDFPQLENGIGMVRLMLMNFQKRRRKFVAELEKTGRSYLMLTAELATQTLEGMADYLSSRLSSGKVRVKTVVNNFFGEQITVSGLLTAGDILAQCKAEPDESVILPANIFNHDGLTLDEVSQLDLKNRLERPLLLVDQFFEDWEWI
jgi:putative radical SAM enzyme (TIGR03279 family)